MLDGVMRRIVAPPLDRLAGFCIRLGVTANGCSLAGMVWGLACGAAVSQGMFLTALACLALSRIADGLDGAIARRTRPTDFGGYLDIVCDFVFYASLPLGFALLDPAAFGLAAATLLASFYVNGASFLGFAALAAKRGLTGEARGPKAFYFTTGLAEGTETIAVFAAALLWPAWFPILAYGFALVCLATTIARVMLARRVFAVDD